MSGHLLDDGREARRPGRDRRWVSWVRRDTYDLLVSRSPSTPGSPRGLGWVVATTAILLGLLFLSNGSEHHVDPAPGAVVATQTAMTAPGEPSEASALLAAGGCALLALCAAAVLVRRRTSPSHVPLGRVRPSRRQRAALPRMHLPAVSRTLLSVDRT